jgi:hypothetical protein
VHPHDFAQQSYVEAKRKVHPHDFAQQSYVEAKRKGRPHDFAQQSYVEAKRKVRPHDFAQQSYVEAKNSCSLSIQKVSAPCSTEKPVNLKLPTLLISRSSRFDKIV